MTYLSEFSEVEHKLCIELRSQEEHLSPPFERSGHRMICDSEYLYLVGGYCPTYPGQLIRDVWRFNILTEEWCLVLPDSEDDSEYSPSEMASFAMCSDGLRRVQNIYVFGGSSVPFGHRSSSCVSVLRRIENKENSFKWDLLPTDGNKPFEQYGSSILYCDSSIYLFGGTTGFEFNMEVRRLLPKVEKRYAAHDPPSISDVSEERQYWNWRLLNDGKEEDGRYKHECILFGRVVLILGGGIPSRAETFDQILAYNMDTNAFYHQPTFPDENYGYPKARLCHSCVKCDNRVLMCGGCSEQYGRQMLPDLYDDVWDLNLSTWRWSKMEHKRLTHKVCFHSSALTEDGCWYVFGGAIDQAFRKRTNLLQRVWLKPPSLYFLAAKAIVSFYHEVFDTFRVEVTVNNIVSLVAKYIYS
ncbi:hypothetical protein AB6A40_003176 [Gnathostoma spinigerum]|uniref:Kelch domain-containing protein 10 n=1 Tax=Gnathostoma spinigerum TaxID=75299 RepID=A0ABD6EB24_9BILA